MSWMWFRRLAVFTDQKHGNAAEGAFQSTRVRGSFKLCSRLNTLSRSSRQLLTDVYWSSVTVHLSMTPLFSSSQTPSTPMERSSSAETQP